MIFRKQAVNCNGKLLIVEICDEKSFTNEKKYIIIKEDKVNFNSKN